MNCFFLGSCGRQHLLMLVYFISRGARLGQVSRRWVFYEESPALLVSVGPFPSLQETFSGILDCTQGIPICQCGKQWEGVPSAKAVEETYGWYSHSREGSCLWWKSNQREKGAVLLSYHGNHREQNTPELNVPFIPSQLV